MDPDTIKASLTSCWMSLVCTVGVVGDFASPASWIALVCAAFLPPVAVWQWHSHAVAVHGLAAAGARR